MSKSYLELEEVVGYSFSDRAKLKKALTHSSFANERKWVYSENNERLEFLGDAVLELISSEVIYEKYPDMTEGEMTKMRASLVCEPSLAFSARQIGLGEYLQLGKGEAMTGGATRDSILSDAFEAVIGAIYLDGGFTNAKEFVVKYVMTDIENKQLFYDSKTILQEIVQAGAGKRVEYQIVNEVGPDHAKEYHSLCIVNQKKYGIGVGKSKKEAEQHAAYETILMLRQEKDEKCI